MTLEAPTNMWAAISRRIQPRKKATALAPGGTLSTIGYVAFLVTGTLSACLAYLFSIGSLDYGLAGTALFLVAVSITTPPKEAWTVAGLLLAYCVIAMGATLNVPKNTWPEEIIRSLSTIIFSCLLFFAGYAARLRFTTRMLLIIEWVAVAMFVVLIGTILAKRGLLSKNIIGGMTFEMTMLWAGARFARLGTIVSLPLWIGGALLFAGLATGHRLIAGIAIPLGFGLWIFQYLRTPLSRAVPPIAAITIAVFSVWLFMNYNNVAAFADVDQIVKAQTGRSTLSGRQEIWRPLIDAASNAPVLGYGPTVKASDISGENLSTHNAYIYVWLQTGPVGFAVVCVIFGFLILQSVMAKRQAAGAMLSVFLMGVLVHCTYENVLFTNCFPIAALCWLNMGFYVAACRIEPSRRERAAQAKARSAPMIRPEDLNFKRPW